MSEKVCYINQPYGLGDIIICEPIARHYYNLGYKIKYWVADEYMWIQDYIPYIEYISSNDESYISSSEVVFKDDYIYLPCMQKRVSEKNSWLREGWLYDKYIISNLDPRLWMTFDFNRNIEKENNLFNLFNLEGKDYILINESSSVGHRTLNIDTKYEVIKMSKIESYTMLDWIKIMENAKEVHTVSTSTVFPLMKIKHNNVTIYSRNNLNKESTFYSIKDVFKPYEFKYEK
jgi:hypothetical protein